MLPRRFVGSLRLQATWVCLPVLIVLCWAALAIGTQIPIAAQPRTETETKLNTSALVVAPNLSAQLAKFKPVRMPFDSARLSPREQQLVGKLVKACQSLEAIYCRQSDPEGHLATTMMHEISHGLGPAFARTRFGQPPTHLLGQRLGLQHHTRLRA